MNFDLKPRQNLGDAVIRTCEKSPRFKHEMGDDDMDDDSLFSSDTDANNQLEEDLRKLKEEDKDKEKSVKKNVNNESINGGEEVCANGHDVRLIDPSYNNYSMDYYESLWGKITCVKHGCKNEGLTLGELMKKNIMVHVCKKCEIYEDTSNCSYMMCNTCKVMEEDGSGRQRRSKRSRN